MSDTKTTRLAAEFKDSPRYQSILAVFKAVDSLEDHQPVNEVMAKMNRTARDLNGEERARLPELVRRALKERGRSGPF